jgi:outer membrane immunogenic protein
VAQTLDYFGTVRGRLGVVDRGNLFYITGGGAYGHVSQAVTSVINAANIAAFEGTVSSSENKFGWVVGAGLESAIGGNWTTRIEYLYMDLGSTGTAGVLAVPLTLAASGMLISSANSTIHDNIIRAGLNYRFGPATRPASAYDAMAAAPPVYSWAGFYIGANVGYGFANNHNQIDVSEPGTPPTSQPGTSVAPKGALGGVQVGYNWQAAPRWVAGFEADLQGTAQTNTACSSLGCFNQTFGGQPLFTSIITDRQQLDYFGTLRGRVGAVFNNTLFYATGGGAFARVRETIDVNSGISGALQPVIANQSFSKDLFGYAVGGGIEAAAWGGWSIKAEYLYLNLGSMTNNMDISAPGAAPATLVSTSTVRDHIVRIGANYHIGGASYQ